MTDTPCLLSVIIKALDEEAHVAGAIRSALLAVEAAGGGEVVLADSCSRDRTVPVAAAYPVRIVQLLDPRERCCGIGPQLGLQHARGEYVYLMDGDMRLAPGFLEQALAFLAQHPEVAGVGGRVVERNQQNLEYRERTRRMQAQEAHRQPGAVDRLDGGALYRRRAIREVGYLSDRNLHSYEELDLAARLRVRGWKLWRLPVDAVSHEGHRTPALRLLWRRWTTGYACGSGEVLRAALGRPWLRLVLHDLGELRLYAGVWAWWGAMAAVAAAPWPAAWQAPAQAGLAALAAGPLLAVSARKRSLARGGYALASWCVNAAGLARGLLRPRRPPQARIASRVLREPQGGACIDGIAPVAPARPRPPWMHRS
ncbi:glycosyltransferase family 2 protein [Ramlibacter sp. MAHUQ-53]|uniref:glycosyltransferase family 2 protein n=1 Tax=unclassified Ramlibacter TaxID=2617605 RepID=UPI003645263D